MKSLIQEKLYEIEKRENCRILLAVESGSRAWGFASSNSDYDVRFIYVRSIESYLKLNRPRDVIELSTNGVLDINGWDLEKMLKLLHKSNPTVFEWLSSPIVYQTTNFVETLKTAMQHYFSPKSALWHYLQMAEKNYRGYLRGDMVIKQKNIFMCCGQFLLAAGYWKEVLFLPCSFLNWQQANCQITWMKQLQSCLI